MPKQNSIDQRIAIVGIGGIFPGASTLDDYWRLIISGISSSEEVPPERWSVKPDDCFHEQLQDDHVYSKKACLIDHIDLNLDGLAVERDFVEKLDPMFHVLLHAGREAWLDTQTNDINKGRTGIAIGNIALPTEYASKYTDDIFGQLLAKQLGLKPPPTNDIDAINRYVAGLPAGLLAQALQIRAGTYTLDAACASSLYALKYAADALLSGRADCMLAGGLSRPDSQYTQMGFSQLHALSPSGNCSPFSSEADGLVVGEGAGLVVLKRLDDAIKHGDHIYACIAGIGLSNDVEGNLFLPASEGQFRAMHDAYEQSKWPVHSVDLIECHGTGTPKGDKVEFQSLMKLWEKAPVDQQCVIGSVKSNVGHLLTAAGAAGLIKTLLALKHRVLPPTANFEKANPEIALEHSPFEVLTEARPWETSKGKLRRAAISAFGFGGINAHVLLEEFKTAEQAPQLQNDYIDEPIAIIACAAQAGSCKSGQDLKQAFFSTENVPEAKPAQHWYGYKDVRIKTHSIPEVDVPLGRFRIPPTELADCLPQQLLMLNVAADAMDQVRSGDDPQFRCGTFIGIGLDPHTCDFHFRWNIKNYVRDYWGSDLNEDERLAFTQTLRDAVGPALSANRTMGALGGIVASRVARSLRIGGPSFTVSNEECSGLQALALAVESLRRNEIDQALVGAVDFNSELRAALSHSARRPIGDSCDSFDLEQDQTLLGDGACAFIVKRLSDAKRDGNKIIACIDHVYQQNGGAIDSAASDQEALYKVLDLAYPDSEFLNGLGLLVCHGSGNKIENSLEKQAYTRLFKKRTSKQRCAVSNSISDIGHTGAASALFSVLKASFALSHKVIPQHRHNGNQVNLHLFENCYSTSRPHFWLRNKESGPRKAAVTAMSCDGNVMHAVLSEFDNETEPLAERAIINYQQALFLCAAENEQSLIEELDALKHFCEVHQDVHEAAHYWWHNTRPHGLVRCSIVIQDLDNLTQVIAEAQRLITKRESAQGPHIYYLHQQGLIDGEIAFVYPGSGNHHAGMAAEHSALWPGALHKQDLENQKHSAQFADARFWSENDCSDMDHRDVIFGQVCVGTMITDILNQFEIKPNAVIGYSLGETAGFFSTRTWTDRDEMLKRIYDSRLFTEELAGKCTAAQRAWNEQKPVNWSIVLINRSHTSIKEAMDKYNRVYLLIVNTPQECVVGGDADQVRKLTQELACQAHTIQGVTTVHCEVAKQVEKSYRDLHLFTCTAPKGVRFYSGIWGKSYQVNTEKAADSIIGQAIEAFDYTKVINQAYDDGVRFFIEMGPGASCSRMINEILKDNEHIALAAQPKATGAQEQIMNILACVHAAGKHTSLDPLYGHELPDHCQVKCLQVANGRSQFSHVSKPQPRQIDNTITKEPEIPASRLDVTSEETTSPVNNGFPNTQLAFQQAHQQFLQVQSQFQKTISEAIHWQQQALAGLQPEPMTSNNAVAELPGDHPQHPVNPSPSGEPVLFDYQQCMEIAIGKIGNVIPELAEADHYPTRVRLPDEPLMLAHRIMRIDGTVNSMTNGRVITEHDIKADAWYLDSGVIPTCIAVEAGQADLFLSGYLGIDQITKGQAVYRLLDAEVCFHAPLPGPGTTIRYDIELIEFFKQGSTHLFRFQFDATVNGKLLLTMRKGIAGFFTQAELDAGKGVVLTSFEKQKQEGICPENWQPPLPLVHESYNESQLQALRNGDLAMCFGPTFKNLPIQKPATLPDGRMRLVHRIKQLIPDGGRFGLGQIIGEADIHPDDWFLTCHFCDDMVMPGTLMYECCLHTLRVYLMRMGWLGEDDDIHYEPIPGISSILKCRGQVLQSSKMVTYELTIKEIGYRDSDQKPYCIADALMYGDGKAIVHMKNMSVQIAGLTKSSVDALWSSQKIESNPLNSDPDFSNDNPIFTNEQIVAFAEGNPSEAFGERYRIFDQERKIARLPRDPFKFLDRITQIRDCTQWEHEAGGTIVARYDVPPDAWYFQANEQSPRETMPFSVLLETALQPCGWLAAYLGSALTSDTDIKFRNLGGQATQYIEITPDIGTLSTRVYISDVSSSGGMIIQNYDMEMWSARGLVYKGKTVFGFFSEAALANQIGIRDAKLPAYDQTHPMNAQAYPLQSPYPNQQMNMIREIKHYDPNGGQFHNGIVVGGMPVEPEAWFFQAHFYQDPVIPGSLGLESFLQLLKFAAIQRWAPNNPDVHFESMACNHEHSWVYRGQVIPKDQSVTVMAEIKEVDDQRQIMIAQGYLLIDGRCIYQMIDFSIRLRAT